MELNDTEKINQPLIHKQYLFVHMFSLGFALHIIYYQYRILPSSSFNAVVQNCFSLETYLETYLEKLSPSNHPHTAFLSQKLPDLHQ